MTVFIETVSARERESLHVVAKKKQIYYCTDDEETMYLSKPDKLPLQIVNGTCDSCLQPLADAMKMIDVATCTRRRRTVGTVCRFRFALNTVHRNIVVTDCTLIIFHVVRPHRNTLPLFDSYRCIACRRRHTMNAKPLQDEYMHNMTCQ